MINLSERRKIVAIIKRYRSDFSSVEPKVIPIKPMSRYRKYGPITSLLENPMISEVLIYGIKDVYYEKKGTLMKSNVTFANKQDLNHFLESQLAKVVDRVNQNDGIVYAKLSGGILFNVIFPPLAIHGPIMTFRKGKTNPFTHKRILDCGTFTIPLVTFVQKSVANGLNILVSGEEGSGKTSTLNLLSTFIEKDRRIFTIEDGAELTLFQDHVMRFDTRSPQIEKVAIRDVLIIILQMRPESLVIGEIVGSEVYDLLKAMSTGQKGVLTTVCAKTPEEALVKCETMAMTSGRKLSVKSVRSEIVQSIDLIIHQSFMNDGTRKITHVVKVDKLKGNRIVLQDLFIWSASGELVPAVMT